MGWKTRMFIWLHPWFPEHLHPNDDSLALCSGTSALFKSVTNSGISAFLETELKNNPFADGEGQKQYISFGDIGAGDCEGVGDLL